MSALFKETYRDIVPELFETTSVLYDKVKGKNVQKAGPASLILPKKMTPGGQFRTFSTDGGDLGRGNAAIYAEGSATPLPFAEAIEINKGVEWNTATTTIAVLNATSEAMEDAADELGTNLDKVYHTAGDAVMATVNVSGTTYTAQGSMRARRLRAQSFYQQYDTTLATNRGRVQVTAVPNDTDATFTVDQAPVGSTNGDKLLVDGVSGASPTFINGLYNLHSSSSSGTVNGLSRVTYAQLRTPEMVVSGALSQSALYFGIAQVRMIRNNTFASGNWALYGSQAQEVAIMELATPMMIWNQDRSGGGKFDPLLKTEDLRVGGLKYYASRNADPTRVDLIDFNNWGRAETLPIGLYDVDDTTIFPIYGASGGLAAAQIFYLVGIHQTFLDDYQRAFIWSSLTVPGGSTGQFFN